jgi:hypothetical protein
LPPASSTIAALETTEIYLASTKFFADDSCSKDVQHLTSILGDDSGFSSQQCSPPHHNVITITQE